MEFGLSSEQTLLQDSVNRFLREQVSLDKVRQLVSADIPDQETWQGLTDLGLPGLLIYKIVNTADSMIGYRTPRHADFGWAAARLDDVLNLIPARLTALLIALPGGVLGQWRAIAADAALHRSPNAGWPEAAMARSIDVALAGPRAYDGVMQQFAWVHGAGGRHPGPPAIDAAITRLWQAWGVMLGLCLLFALLF